MKEEDICGGSLNTIWAGGALGDTEVEVRCGRGEEEFARGKHPGGVVFFKNSEDESESESESESEMSTDHLFVYE